MVVGGGGGGGVLSTVMGYCGSVGMLDTLLMCRQCMGTECVG